MDGNSKGIMRVILAMAERYQPRSVKQRSVSDPKPYSVMQQQNRMHHQQRDHTPPDRLPHRDHMTPEYSPPTAPRTRSPPNGFRLQSHNVMSSNSLAANSFSVPNMASLNIHVRPAPAPPPSRPISGRKSYKHSPVRLSQAHAQRYGPPQIGQGALSQPQRYMRNMERGQNEEISMQMYSLSQADMENDVYSTPVNQLPPSAGTRIIAPQKKLGR